MLPRLNDATFDQAIKSSTPILVTFSAPVRCEHCRDQKPALEALAMEGVPVYVVDVEQPDTFGIEAKLGGRGVPFSKVYAGGQLLVEGKVGKLSAQELLHLYREGSALAAAAAPPPRRGPPKTTVASTAPTLHRVAAQFGRRS